MTTKEKSLEMTNVTWLIGVVTVFLLANTVDPIAGFLEFRWPSVALGGILFCALILLYRTDGSTPVFNTLTRFNWILLAVYLVHQFEEHGIDLLGRTYYFQEYANAQLEARGMTLTSLAILNINTIAVWMAFLLAVWGGERFTWPGLAAAGLMMINGVLHMAIAVTNGEYNPGLLTAVVLFLPTSVLYLRYVRIEHSMSFWAIGGGVAFGLVGHAVLPAIIAADAPILVLVSMTLLPLVLNSAAVWVVNKRGT